MRELVAERRGLLGHPEHLLPVRLADLDGHLPHVEVERHAVSRSVGEVLADHPRRPEGGVAGEGDLLGRGEDADRPRAVGGRPDHKRRLGVVELGGDRLHLRGREARRVRHDGELVARVLLLGEHVDDVKLATHSRDIDPALQKEGGRTVSRSRRRQSGHPPGPV
jgi:hypothetical protein